MENVNINAGIKSFHSGNKADALRIFLEVIKHEPKNEIAWLWLAACVEKPEQKRDCFLKVLAINPNNVNAQKALAELELQKTSSAKPIPRSGSILKCPSCGSPIGEPDHTGMIQCGYCGTSITYQPPTEKLEQKNIERYLELCNASLAGKNYEEALLYANKVLEIDPKCVDAWINKGIAANWLTTSSNNRYEEALEYLKKAEELSPTNEKIQKVRGELTYQQAHWYVYLGGEKEKLGDEIYDIYMSGSYYEITDIIGRPMKAQQESASHFDEAMKYYLLAASYLPSDISILENIANLVKKRNWLIANTMVQRRLIDLQMLIAKPIANDKLPKLRKELAQAQKEFSELNKSKNLFNVFKLDNLEDKIKKIKDEIVESEKILEYEVLR